MVAFSAFRKQITTVDVLLIPLAKSAGKREVVYMFHKKEHLRGYTDFFKLLTVMKMISNQRSEVVHGLVHLCLV